MDTTGDNEFQLIFLPPQFSPPKPQFPLLNSKNRLTQLVSFPTDTPYTHKPLSKKLEIVSYDSALHIQCSWCNDLYNETDEIVKLDCNHYWHKKCADKYLTDTYLCHRCMPIDHSQEFDTHSQEFDTHYTITDCAGDIASQIAEYKRRQLNLPAYLPPIYIHNISSAQCVWCDKDFDEKDEIVKFRCDHRCHKKCVDEFSLKTDEMCYDCNPI